MLQDNLRLFSTKVKKFTKAILLLVLFLCISILFNGADNSRAAVGTPKLINFQGKLNGSTNLPVDNGSYNIRVRIYQDSDSTCTDGTLKWTEERKQTNRVSVSSGLFNILLGSLTTLDLAFNDDDFWVQVSVGGTENTATPSYEDLAPCQRIGSVGYAYNADTVDGIHASSTATANYLLPLDVNVDFSLPDDSKVGFRDVGIYIQSSADGKLLISSDGSGNDDITLSGTVTTNDNITVTNGKGLIDSNGNEFLLFSTTTSAVNELTVKNAATTKSPALMATGTDSNIGIDLVVKGTGSVNIGNKLAFNESNGTNITYIQGGDQSADVTYTLPVAAPAVTGYVLSATDAGVMSWVVQSGGTGDITDVGSMITGAAFADATADDDWLGLGVSAGRIEFDDQTIDEVNILTAKLGVGTQTPAANLEVEISATGALTGLLVDQDDLDQIGLQITQAADATANALDISSSQISGNIVDLDYSGAETQTGALAGLNLDFTNLTTSGSHAFYGISINDQVGNTASTEYGLYIQGTNWDYGIYSEDAIYAGTTLNVVTSQTITGTADGTDALTLTTGDIQVTDGDFTLSAGDFDVTLDAGDTAGITSAGSTVGVGLSVDMTTGATNAGPFSGQLIATTFTNYADDGATDDRSGLNIVVTNNATDAGTDDNIYGISVQNLGGSNNADGNEYAIYQAGTGWDYGLYVTDAAYFGSTLSVLESTGATYKTIIQGGDQSADVTYTLPVAAPAVTGYVLSATTGGVMSWAAQSSGTGDITAVGSMVTNDAFADATADDDWLGLGASAGRIEFDDQTIDEVNILSANVGINTSTPGSKLDILFNSTGIVGDANKVFNLATTGATFNTTGGNLSNYGAYFSNTSTESAGGNVLTNIAMYLAASGADANYALITNGGNVGIGTTAPTALLSVAEKFLVDSNGNITKINNIAYSWPAAQGAASTVLTNNGSGTLSWASPATRGVVSNLTVQNNQPDSYTKLLLHAKGTDGGTTLLDSSNYMHTINAGYDSQIDTAKYKFDSSSVLFDGSYDMLYSSGSNDNWNFGAGNFTIDFWGKFDAGSYDANNSIIDLYNEPISNASFRLDIASDKKLAWYAYANGTYYYVASTNALDTNWNHIAVVRNGSTITLYINGVSNGTTNIGSYALNTGNSRLEIGNLYNYESSYGTPCSLDEIRISKGIARWTADFSVPTSEYEGYPQYKVDTTADSVVMFDGTNALEARNVDLTADITSGGANGLDTGAEGSSTWYYLWVISNGTTTAGLLSTSSTAPTMPGGYTYKKLVSVVYNDSASNFRGFAHIGDQYQYTYPIKIVDNGGSTTTVSIGLSTYTPNSSIVKGVFGKLRGNGSNHVMINPITFPNSTTVLDNNIVNYSIYASDEIVMYDLPILIENQTMYYQTTGATIDLWITGFTTKW